MGRTQSFLANAAYSLYGVKNGQTVSDSSGCRKKHYINSFFTNMGVESFTDPFGIDADAYGASSECTSAQNGNGRKLQENYYTHGQSVFGDYTSYGTGCSEHGKFVLATFEGAYCNGGHYVATTDDLDYLNNDLDELGCNQIYSGYDGQQGDRKLDDNNQDIAAELLAYSNVCNMLEYPIKCPDPYGLKVGHESSLKRAADQRFKKVPAFMPIMSTIFCAAALFFYYLTEKTKYSAKTKRIETKSIDKSAGPAESTRPEPPFILQMADTFSRTITTLSTRTQSFKEKLIDYAEAENDQDGQNYYTYDDDDKSYQTAESSVKSVNLPQQQSIPAANTFSRTATNVSLRNPSLNEKLIAYAEAENDKDDQESIKSTQSIKSVHSAASQPVQEPTTGQAPKEGEESDAQVANAMLSAAKIENDMAAKSTKKFKRPRFARITKFLFRKRNQKNIPSTSFSI